MLRASFLLVCVAAIVGCSGCSGGAGVTAREEVARDEPVTPGPVVISEDEIERERQTAPRVRVFTEGESLPRRRDGRPLWWLDEPFTDRGTTRFCVETIGDSIREARRSVIVRAQESAARLGAVGGIEYERIWVWPARSTGGVRTRYSAFVMASVSASE